VFIPKASDYTECRMASPASLPIPNALTGNHVVLETLRPEPAPELSAALWQLAAPDCEAIFRWYAFPITTETAMREWLEKALAEQQQGVSVPFITRANADNALAGGTRFMTIDAANRKCEIGNTWLAPRFQRTALNTEAKYLMLRHAFEVWDFVRVEFRTDVLNTQSRIAIARLGAQEEGIFRNHTICAGGRLRDSIYFSVIASEWPEMKRRLERLLAK
jgi:N-acetyltransferase